MVTSQFRRIYFYHLKKCGGSTLNHWLDTLTSDNRTDDPTWNGSWLLGDPVTESSTARASRDAARARSMFYWADVIHTHAALRAYAPPATLCMTMLRDPVDRLVSQVSDWRRLGEKDVALELQSIAACVQDSRQLSLREFLLRHAFGDSGRRYLHNYMTRALAAGRIGRLVLGVDDPERLLEVAMQSLEQDYDFVGITEHYDLSLNALSALAGLPATRPVEKINASRNPGDDSAEIAGLTDLLDDLTRTDRVLYDHACSLFQRRHRKDGETYDSAMFETRYAEKLLSELRGRHSDGATRYSVHGPIIGSGFYGRDGAGLDDCAVWTGPGRITTLYIPTPLNTQVSVLLWIRGFVTPGQREQLRIRIDRKPLPHRFETIDGHADLLVAETLTNRPFVRLDLEFDLTEGFGEPGSGIHDPRKRGLAFDAYGWRLT